MTLKKLNTTLVEIGREKKYCQGSVNSLIQRASSIVFDSVEKKEFAIKHRGERALFYGRRGTLTHFSFQDAMAQLEGGAGCVLYPSGAAAIANSILSFVKAGDNVLMSEGAYEPTQAFCEQILTQFNVATHYYDPMDATHLEQQINEKTSLVFLEAPSSITMEVPDIDALVKVVRQINPEIVIMIDNTWAAGVLFKPLERDIDISIQSATKYILGHSDGMMGTATANLRCWKILRERSYLMGQIVDADTAYMASRGLRTLAVRLAHHEKSALKIANWLNSQPQVLKVNHPALVGAAGHQHYLKYFLGSCGLFSFVLKEQLTAVQLAQFLDNFSLFKMAYSWGGFESLIMVTDAQQLKAMRPVGRNAICGTLFRLHVGLEDVDDLIDDLAKGLARL